MRDNVKGDRIVVFRGAAALVPICMFLLNGCPGSNLSLSETEMFRKFLVDPIPSSVVDLRADRRGTLSDPLYVLGFRMSRDDLQLILKAKPFGEEGRWEFDARANQLRWQHAYQVKDPVDENKTYEEGNDLPYGWWAREPLTEGRLFHRG